MNRSWFKVQVLFVTFCYPIFLLASIYMQSTWKVEKSWPLNKFFSQIGLISLSLIIFFKKSFQFWYSGSIGFAAPVRKLEFLAFRAGVLLMLQLCFHVWTNEIAIFIKPLCVYAPIYLSLEFFFFFYDSEWCFVFLWFSDDMVDPLKVFWVLTNSTYLGKTLTFLHLTLDR